MLTGDCTDFALNKVNFRLAEFPNSFLLEMTEIGGQIALQVVPMQ